MNPDSARNWWIRNDKLIAIPELLIAAIIVVGANIFDVLPIGVGVYLLRLRPGSVTTQQIHFGEHHFPS